MAIICKNCKNSFEGKFCNLCGQSAGTHKLDLHFLWHDIQHGLFHFDNGLFYTAKELFTRPGHTIREFLEGKRVKHFKPISLIIILATVYSLIYHFFHISTASISESEAVNTESFKIIEWITNHYAWATLCSIPIYTIGTYICFKKQNYNFIEYLILNSFKAGQRLIFHIVSLTLLVIFHESTKTRTITLIIYLIDLILGFWTNIQFFDKLSAKKTIVLSILSHLIFFIILSIFFYFIIELTKIQ